MLIMYKLMYIPASLEEVSLKLSGVVNLIHVFSVSTVNCSNILWYEVCSVFFVPQQVQLPVEIDNNQDIPLFTSTLSPTLI